MDFRGRMNQSSDRPASTPSNQPTAAGTPRGPLNDTFASSPLATKVTGGSSKLLRFGPLILLFSLTILVISLTVLMAFSGNRQQRAVMKDKYQAVVLNNGQAYFGKIASVGGKTLDLRGIYYLQTNNTTGDKTQTTNRLVRARAWLGYVRWTARSQYQGYHGRVSTGCTANPVCRSRTRCSRPDGRLRPTAPGRSPLYPKRIYAYP